MSPHAFQSTPAIVYTQTAQVAFLRAWRIIAALQIIAKLGHYPMEGEENFRTEKFLDKKTGRRVFSKHPTKPRLSKDGHVFRQVPKEEFDKRPANTEGYMIGGDLFEMVPVDEVEIE